MEDAGGSWSLALATARLTSLYGWTVVLGVLLPAGLGGAHHPARQRAARGCREA